VSIDLGIDTSLANAIGIIPAIPVMVAVSWPRGGVSRALVRISSNGGGANITIGDGVATAVMLVGTRRVTAPNILSRPAYVGMLGIALPGGAVPQIPLRNAGGRVIDWEQEIDLTDAYTSLGICSLVADIVLGGALTIDVSVVPLIGSSRIGSL
jgi:hypothetical protein